MADARPPLPSQNSGSFAHGLPQVHFGGSASLSFPGAGVSMPSFDSQTHLELEPGGDYDDDSEELPLNDGQNFGGGFYPPPPISPGAYDNSYVPGSVSFSMIKRGKTRKVKLTNGNFIAEYPVPASVFSALEERWRSANTTEFSHMRYTAATCDPDDFTEENGWSMRTKLYNRHTELLIAVTSYNENKTLYARTLHGVMLNIRDICKSKQSKYWRQDAEDGTGWQKIAVALVVDGLKDMDMSVLDILASIGVYQDGIMKKQVDGKDTVAHIFEYTTQLSIDATPQLFLPQPGDPNNLVPVQIMLVIKAKNQKKINSHRWLFNAIGKTLEPEVCVLLDAGTKPGHKSIFYLWEAFYNDPHLGGCCGEIHAMIKGGKKLLNPLVAAQNFQYKMSCILDKTLESSIGYVSVLPGAFSAYRFRAILGRPLEQYFHGDHSLAHRLGYKDMNIFTKNMFLAEDRILCFELVVKKNERWTLTFVKPSKAETDVPEIAAELIGQRRRWLNGSFAASVYALVHFRAVYGSSHGPIRKFFLHVQALYNLFGLVFSWFAMANLWLSFSIIINLLPRKHIYLFGNATSTFWVNFGFKAIYVFALALQFILALGNHPKHERIPYVITFWVFGFLAGYVLLCSIWLMVITFSSIPSHLTWKSASQFILTVLSPPIGALIAAMISTFGIYLTASILYGDPWHMFSSLLQYLCIEPSFINILNVYAFCNLHDVSWGTKGLDKAVPLPSVNSSKLKGAEPAVVEDQTAEQADVDDAFIKTVDRAITKIVKKGVPEKPSLDDQNKTFRTRLVAVWMLTNALLAIAIEGMNGLPSSDPNADQISLIAKQSAYFAVILYSTFAMSFIRFIGCLYYLFKRGLFQFSRKR